MVFGRHKLEIALVWFEITRYQSLMYVLSVWHEAMLYVYSTSSCLKRIGVGYKTGKHWNSWNNKLFTTSTCFSIKLCRMKEIRSHGLEGCSLPWHMANEKLDIFVNVFAHEMFAKFWAYLQGKHRACSSDFVKYLQSSHFFSTMICNFISWVRPESFEEPWRTGRRKIHFRKS